MTAEMKEMTERVMELDGLATKGPWKAGLTQYSRRRPHFLAPVSNPERTIANTCDGPRKSDQSSNDANLIAFYRTAAPLLAAEVTRLTKAIEDAPHELTCETKISTAPVPSGWLHCNCWKSRALSTLTASEKPKEQTQP